MNYVRDAIAKGLSKSQIEVSLIQRGWPKKEVDRIFDELEGGKEADTSE